MPWSSLSVISLRSSSAWASSCSAVFGLGGAEQNERTSGQSIWACCLPVRRGFQVVGPIGIGSFGTAISRDGHPESMF